MKTANLRKFASLARSLRASAMTIVLGAALGSRAVTITNGPTFTPAPLAPLAGLLQFSTDVPSRVSVSVTDGTETWERNFHDYSSTHSVPLLGFKPGRTNAITITARDKDGNAAAAPQPLLFQTGPLPDEFPKSELLASQPDKMEPGYTLFRVENLSEAVAYLTMVDNAGQVVWYSDAPSVLDVRQLPNGHLFLPMTTNFVEMDMLGNTVQTWTAPDGYPINYHDGALTSHNSILYISDAYVTLSNFPSSSMIQFAPLVTTNALYNRIVEISTTNGAVLNVWSLVDMLQPTRIDYLTYSPGYADLEHANAVLEDPGDNSIIVSMRHQDAVLKFARDTGEIKWILGPHENWDTEFQPYLLTPVGAPFAWNYGQHGPMLTPQGTLLVYDDGNYRASPFDSGLPDADNYSRSVEYSINETNMEASQVWEYSGTNTDRLYTGLMGNTDWLPVTGNVLVDFPWITYENGSAIERGPMVRIKEVTHDPVPEVVFDLSFYDYSNSDPGFAGYYAYRSHRVPDLYSVLPAPVEDLAVKLGTDGALLQFSGNEANTYTIQASTDLVQWTALGTAEDTGSGDYEFTDTASRGTPIRYYRVLTR